MAPVEEPTLELTEEEITYFNKEAQELSTSFFQNEKLEKIGTFISSILNFSLWVFFVFFFKNIYKRIRYLVDTFEQLPEENGLVFCETTKRPFRPFYTKNEIFMICRMIFYIVFIFAMFGVFSRLDVLNRSEFTNSFEKKHMDYCTNVTKEFEHEHTNCSFFYKKRDSMNSFSENMETWAYIFFCFFAHCRASSFCFCL